MTRAADFAAMQYVNGVVLPVYDMTPTPLTAADFTTAGAGPWTRNPGTAGGIEVTMSNSIMPTASTIVEYTNDYHATTGVNFGDTHNFTTEGEKWGVICLNGYIWVRTRNTAISGDNASTTATLGVGTK